MANKPPETRQAREKMVYYNEARLAAYEEIKGRMVLLPKVDSEGNAYKEAMKIPDTLQEITYLGFDYFTELVQRQLEGQDG